MRIVDHIIDIWIKREREREREQDLHEDDLQKDHCQTRRHLQLIIFHHQTTKIKVLNKKDGLVVHVCLMNNRNKLN